MLLAGMERSWGLLAGFDRSLQELNAPCKIHAALGKIKVTVQKGWACHGECSTLLARIERSSQELTTACKNPLLLLQEIMLLNVLQKKFTSLATPPASTIAK